MKENSFQQPDLRLITKRKINWPMLGGIFLLTLFIIGGFFVRNNSRDNLLRYAPVDSIVYAHATEIDYLFFEKWIAAINSFYNQDILTPEVLEDNKAIAVSFIENENKLEPIIFLKTEDRNIYNKLSELQYTVKLSKNTLAIAISESSLNKISSIEGSDAFSLQTKISPWKNSYEQLNLYIDIDKIKPLISPKDLGGQVIDRLLSGSVRIAITKKQNQWLGTVDLDQPLAQAPTKASVPSILPDDFVMTSIGINLESVINAIILSNDELKISLGQLQARSNEVHGVDVSKNLRELFDHTGAVTIVGDSESAFGFDFIIELPDASIEMLKTFEDLISIMLAQRLPTEIIKILPDGTNVVELIATTSSFNWQDDSIGGSLVRKIDIAGVNFSLAYTFDDQVVKIASSKDLLSQESDSGLIVSKLLDDCMLSVKKQLFIFGNKSEAVSPYLPKGLFALQQDRPTRLKGCIRQPVE